MSAALPPLAGAKDRLLPASVPVPYFAAALAFHGLAWLSLAAAAEWVPGFAGGLGPPLAALHLVTLGVLAMVAVGASLQLLPVALRAPMPLPVAARAVHLLLVAGVPVLAWGMASGRVLPLSLGGVAVSSGLALFAALAAAALARARGSSLVIAHVWTALACLLALALLGLALLGDFVHGWLPDRAALAAVHLAIATYGFLGLLIMGLSQILVPMFALAPNPPARPGWIALGLAAFGVALAGAGWFLAGAIAGLAAALLHTSLMALVLRRRARRRLGPSFVLIGLGWAMLPASLVLGAGLAFGILPRGFAPIFVLVLVGGWLLSTVLGVLMRILPFLATLHAAKRGRRLMRVEELGDERLLWVQVGAHLSALPMVALGAALNAPALVWMGAMVGAVGAGAFLLFAGLVAWRYYELPPRAGAPAELRERGA
ncbi:MAG: hypothetical protein K0S81_1489 [Rhodospirillales bacterium]|jgi:hypothetical protein|nr:hypothetical protein [Rhodospirillales bacterium]